ncbi:MAG: hypothetical protein J0626_08215, partial [Rhodospirillaceae bacterium]|nr:hypothetical protein [Rhodospirillaceae bacterium]
THRLVADFAVLDLGEASVKGKEISTHVKALIGDDALLSDAAYSQIAACLEASLSALVSGNARDALDQLNRCRVVKTDPSLAAFYDHIDGSIARVEAATRTGQS